MKLLEVDEIGEQSRMVHGGDNVQVIMVQDQPLDIVDLVERLALDLLDLVVGQIDHLQLGPVVPDPEQVPGQPLELVPLEDQDLGLGGDVLQHGGIREPRVGAVGHEHFPIRLPCLYNRFRLNSKLFFIESDILF